MDKNKILKTLEHVRKASKKRNFNQTFDVDIRIKNYDIKKDGNIDLFINLPYNRGKKVKICALIGPELAAKAKETCDFVVSIDEFPKYAKDKKAAKKLANECDWFIAQANLMPKVAASFGRVLGPKGKMPNPKASCIVPPTANLEPLCNKLRKTVKVVAKTIPMIQCIVGKEDMKDEEVSDNIWTIYDGLIHHLSAGKDNVRSVFLKLTMSKPVKLEK